jgi:Domain of unknown function (DUF4234)
MAQEEDFDNSGMAKLRSFWVGFGLTIITLGIYHLFWYYFVNGELKEVGETKRDEKLAESSPGLSVVAFLPVVNSVIIPALVSVYKYTRRVKRAEDLAEIPSDRQVKPLVAFLLFFPGMLLLIPLVIHFWYVTKHQNMAIQAAGILPRYSEWGEDELDPDNMDRITRRALKKAGRLP